MELLILLGTTVLTAFAADAVLTAWFYGSIFARWRAYYEAMGGLLGELLTCPLCFSYHVGFWLTLLCVVPTLCLLEAWWLLPLTPLASLAATDLAQWLQGIRSLENSNESDSSPEVDSKDP